jgi:putative transposase
VNNGTHSKAEIANKLSQANGLATQGRPWREIAATLRVSVRSLRRWRRMAAAGTNPQIAELQRENTLLRRLVADLLLEKLALEEMVERALSQADGRARSAASSATRGR